HRAALVRIHKFAELDHLQVESIDALPLPPSVWRWDGLVRGPRGVYELRIDLTDKLTADSELLAREHRYFRDAPPNSYIEAARRLPEVQRVLWFDRFPVTRFRKEGQEAVVEISDLRFARARPGAPSPFTYRVRFGADGSVVSQGWVTREGGGIADSSQSSVLQRKEKLKHRGHVGRGTVRRVGRKGIQKQVLVVLFLLPFAASAKEANRIQIHTDFSEADVVLAI